MPQASCWLANRVLWLKRKGSIQTRCTTWDLLSDVVAVRSWKSKLVLDWTCRYKVKCLMSNSVETVCLNLLQKDSLTWRSVYIGIVAGRYKVKYFGVDFWWNLVSGLATNRQCLTKWTELYLCMFYFVLCFVFLFPLKLFWVFVIWEVQCRSSSSSSSSFWIKFCWNLWFYRVGIFCVGACPGCARGVVPPLNCVGLLQLPDPVVFSVVLHFPAIAVSFGVFLSGIIIGICIVLIWIFAGV